MNKKITFEDLEDYAFCQSGLCADGCLNKLDSYTKDCIKRYGKILLEKQLEDIKKGFKGCCYACEPVAILNQELEEKLYKVQILEEELKIIIEKFKKLI